MGPTSSQGPDKDEKAAGGGQRGEDRSRSQRLEDIMQPDEMTHRGPLAKDCRWPWSWAGRETGSFLEPLERGEPCPHLQLSL